jgi:nicotinamidase-related amidase
MSHHALVVIDVLKGFLVQGPLADPSIARIIPPIQAEIEAALKRKDPVLTFRDAHDEHAAEFDAYPPHCLKGSVESQLVDELMPYADKMIDIEKNTTNGFFAEGFQTFLRQHPEITTYTCVGCCTDICVLQFAITMKTYAQTHKLPIQIQVIEKALDTFELPHHPKISFHDHALSMMRAAGIQII